MKDIKRLLYNTKQTLHIKLSNFIIPDNAINIELIVFGFQKSGTTAIAKLLALNTGKTITIDPPVLWKGIENILKGKTTLKKVIYGNKIIFKTNFLKEPGLTLIADEVMNLFPQSKYLFIVRNPFENIRSILNRLNLPGDYEELPENVFENINNNWKPLIKGELYGITEGNYVERLAQLWVKTINVYLNSPEKFVLVKYEDFLKNKEKIIDSITKQLGYPKVNSIKEYVDVQFQPKGKKVDIKEFFGGNYNKIENICNNFYKTVYE